MFIREENIYLWLNCNVNSDASAFGACLSLPPLPTLTPWLFRMDGKFACSILWHFAFDVYNMEHMPHEIGLPITKGLPITALFFKIGYKRKMKLEGDKVYTMITRAVEPPLFGMLISLENCVPSFVSQHSLRRC